MKGDKPVGKVFDRVLLFVYSLFIGAVAICVLIVASALVPLEETKRLAERVYYDPGTAYPMIAASIVILIISIRFFILSVKRSQGRAPSIDQRTDFGDIRISVETVENLALKAATRQRGVKDLKVRVHISDTGLEITLRAVVDGESPIPELTENVQRAVKEYVEEITGIPVALVSVFIANVVSAAPAFKSRVE